MAPIVNFVNADDSSNEKKCHSTRHRHSLKTGFSTVSDDDETTRRSGIVRLEDDTDRVERARNDVNFDDEQWNDETADFRLVRLCAAHVRQPV